jgi:hypothetical protein
MWPASGLTERRPAIAHHHFSSLTLLAGDARVRAPVSGCFTARTVATGPLLLGDRAKKNAEIAPRGIAGIVRVPQDKTACDTPS